MPGQATPVVTELLPACQQGTLVADWLPVKPAWCPAQGNATHGSRRHSRIRAAQMRLPAEPHLCARAPCAASARRRRAAFIGGAIGAAGGCEVSRSL